MPANRACQRQRAIAAFWIQGLPTWVEALPHRSCLWSHPRASLDVAPPCCPMLGVPNSGRTFSKLAAHSNQAAAARLVQAVLTKEGLHNEHQRPQLRQRLQLVLDVYHGTRPICGTQADVRRQTTAWRTTLTTRQQNSYQLWLKSPCTRQPPGWLDAITSLCSCEPRNTSTQCLET